MYNPPVIRSKDRLKIKHGTFAKIPERVFLLSDDILFFAENDEGSIVYGSDPKENGKYKHFVSRYIKAGDVVAFGEDIALSADSESVLVQYLREQDGTLAIATRLVPPGEPLALRLIDNKIYLWSKGSDNDVALFSRDPYDSDAVWEEVRKVAPADRFRFFDKGGEALVVLRHPGAEDAYLISSPGEGMILEETDTRGLEKRVGQDNPFDLISPLDGKSYWSLLRQEDASYLVLHNIAKGRVEKKFPIKERSYEKMLSGNGHLVLFSKESLLLWRKGSEKPEEIDLLGQYSDITFNGKTIILWSKNHQNFKKIVL